MFHQQPSTEEKIIRKAYGTGIACSLHVSLSFIPRKLKNEWYGRYSDLSLLLATFPLNEQQWSRVMPLH